MKSARIAFLAALAALTLPARAEILTVDDDPGADFSDLPAAIAAAAPGDVLLVADGNYAPFVLGKRLTILGRSDAGEVRVTGKSVVSNVLHVRLAGLRLDALELDGVTREAIVEGCKIGQIQLGVSVPAVSAVLLVRNCANVLISRCTLQGRLGCCGDSPWQVGISFGAGSAGLRIENSSATVVDCIIKGGDGFDGCDYNTGGSGLEVRGGTTVVTGSQLVGGNGGTLQCIFFGSGDPGGDGAWVLDGTLILRGAGALFPNPPDPYLEDYALGGMPGGHPFEDGFDVRAEGTSAVFCSGTSVSSTSSAPSATITFLSLPEPFLEIHGTFAPGATLTVDVRGPAGEPLLLFAARALRASTHPTLDGTVWLAPVGLVFTPLVGAGQTTPVSFALEVPLDVSSYAGLELGFQLLAPNMPGTLDPSRMLLANPAPFLAR